MEVYGIRHVFAQAHLCCSQWRDSMELKGVPDTVEPSRVCYIVEEAGYWRKANAIHRWFVEHVQGGHDDCGLYQVTHTQLRQLLQAVEAVLAQPDAAEHLLPTQPGFFFGSTAYDTSYVENLKATKAIVETALADAEAEFEYVSSW